MGTVLVSITGVNLKHQFILRELSLYFTSEDVAQHYCFGHPLDLHLAREEKQTDRYTQNMLGGLGVYTVIPGSLNYSAHRDILTFLEARYNLICVGHVTHKFISNLLPYADIADIQNTTTFKYPAELPNANCGFNHLARHCCLAKLKYLKRVIMKSVI